MKSKRILSLLMAFVLCLSLLPFAAFAEDEPEAAAIIAEDETETESAKAAEIEEIAAEEVCTESEDSCEPAPIVTEEEAEESCEAAETVTEEITEAPAEDSAREAEEVAGGSCGLNITWSLDSNGKLSISGSGSMYDYSKSPWVSYEVKSAEIGEGVTRIGKNAFYKCKSLTDVSFPSTLTSIGGRAFGYCSSLQDVTFPASLTSIGQNAFKYCSSIKNLVIPNTVKTVYYQAFYCTNLETVTLGSCVSNFRYVFDAYCRNLKTITVDESNPYYSSEDGVLYNKDKTTLIFFPATKTSYVMPDSVTDKEYPAFNYNSLTELTVGSGFANITNSSFYNLRSLESFSIDEDNPYYCSEDGIIYNKDKTTLIYCLYYDGSTLTVPDSVKTIGQKAFWCFSKDQGKHDMSIILPEGVETIESMAFGYCSGVKLSLPSTLTSVSTDLFYYTTFQNIYFNGTSAQWKNACKSSSCIPSQMRFQKNTVYFHLNDGSGGVATDSKELNKSYTIPKTKPTRSGYVFLGWSNVKNATTAKYLPGKSYKTIYLNLYAVWKSADSSITYNANGGTGGPTTGAKQQGQAYTVPTDIPVRAGYTFLGWSGSKTATKASYLPGKTYTVMYLNLYAVWQQN